MQQWVTSSPSWFEPFKDEDVHGGPPLALIPVDAGGGLGRPYYLGVLHFFQVWVGGWLGRWILALHYTTAAGLTPAANSW